VELRGFEPLTPAAPALPRHTPRPVLQDLIAKAHRRPKKTIAEATAIKTHTVSKPLPNGRSKFNPSASIATQTTPLKITGQLVGTSQFG
jgi:hypothetical protein